MRLKFRIPGISKTIQGVEPAGHFFDGVHWRVAGAVVGDFSQRDRKLQLRKPGGCFLYKAAFWIAVSVDQVKLNLKFRGVFGRASFQRSTGDSDASKQFRKSERDTGCKLAAAAQSVNGGARSGDVVFLSEVSHDVTNIFDLVWSPAGSRGSLRSQQNDAALFADRFPFTVQRCFHRCVARM